MKPFDLEKALKGYSVCTETGDKVTKITAVGEDTIIVKTDNQIYIFNTEGVSNLFMADEQDLRDFLIPGNVVVTEEYTYLIQRFGKDTHFVRNDGWSTIRVDEGLVRPVCDECTIKAVYHIRNAAEAGHFFATWEVYDLELLWEKPQFVELTLDEIAKKFNIDVNQLKIKK